MQYWGDFFHSKLFTLIFSPPLHKIFIFKQIPIQTSYPNKSHFTSYLLIEVYRWTTKTTCFFVITLWLIYFFSFQNCSSSYLKLKFVKYFNFSNSIYLNNTVRTSSLFSGRVSKTPLGWGWLIEKSIFWGISPIKVHFIIHTMMRSSSLEIFPWFCHEMKKQTKTWHFTSSLFHGNSIVYD